MIGFFKTQNESCRANRRTDVRPATTTRVSGGGGSRICTDSLSLLDAGAHVAIVQEKI